MEHVCLSICLRPNFPSCHHLRRQFFSYFLFQHISNTNPNVNSHSSHCRQVEMRNECACVCVFHGGGAGVTGPLVPTMTDVQSNKWVTPGAASKAVDGRRFECCGVDDNSCQSCRWRALWAPPPPPSSASPSTPPPPAAPGLLFLPVRSRHFKVTSVFYSLLWCKWEMSDVLWFALSLPVHCPPSRSHSAKVYQHYKSYVLFSKHWEKECWDVDIIRN